MKIGPIDPADARVAALQLPNVYFVGASDGAELAGCGAVKTPADDGVYGEIRRVFVVPRCRGRGLSRAIMDPLSIFMEKRL